MSASTPSAFDGLRGDNKEFAGDLALFSAIQGLQNQRLQSSSLANQIIASSVQDQARQRALDDDTMARSTYGSSMDGFRSQGLNYSPGDFTSPAQSKAHAQARADYMASLADTAEGVLQAQAHQDMLDGVKLGYITHDNADQWKNDPEFRAKTAPQIRLGAQLAPMLQFAGAHGVSNFNNLPMGDNSTVADLLGNKANYRPDGRLTDEAFGNLTGAISAADPNSKVNIAAANNAAKSDRQQAGIEAKQTIQGLTYANKRDLQKDQQDFQAGRLNDAHIVDHFFTQAQKDPLNQGKSAGELAMIATQLAGQYKGALQKLGDQPVNATATPVSAGGDNAAPAAAPAAAPDDQVKSLFTGVSSSSGPVNK